MRRVLSGDEARHVSKIWTPGRIAANMLFPPRCPVCDEPVKQFGEKICTDCLGVLRPIEPPWCMKCGKKIRNDEKLCDDCRKAESEIPHLFDRGRAVFEYRGAAMSIYRYKYGNRPEYADYYGEETVRLLGEYLRHIRPDAIVPVPLHKKRLAQRGYNQALLYAQAISRYSGIPVREALERTRETAPMKELGRIERQNNLKKAFNVCQNDVKFRRLLVVDDIYTTGATMDEAARALKEAGAGKIYFVTLSCGMGV